MEIAFQYGPFLAAADGMDQFKLGDLAHAHPAFIKDGGPASLHGGDPEQPVAGTGVDQI
ncbi:hypothetical protein GCM10010246_84450 [Streptomyces cuspidosporus]|uniref:Uncharacterized protein n=1 Tax=Streptomyces cuspidosporus TaxID=66882 RepID=A0ABP5UCJ2_9ACTN